MYNILEDSLGEIVRYLNPTELANLVDSELLYGKISQKILDEIADRYAVPRTDSVIELDSFYKMTMYRRIQYGDIYFVMNHLMTTHEARILLDETNDPEIFTYVLQRIRKVNEELTYKQIVNGHRLGIYVGPERLHAALNNNDWREILLISLEKIGGGYLHQLAKKNLSPDEYIEILFTNNAKGALDTARREKDGVDREIKEYVLRGNYDPEIVKKWVRVAPYEHEIDTNVPEVVTMLAIMGDFITASEIIGKEITKVEDLIGYNFGSHYEYKHDSYIMNKQWVKLLAIECDNIEVWKRFRDKGGYKDYYVTKPEPRSEAMALEMLRGRVKIFYSKCKFDYRVILKEFPDQANELITSLIKRDDGILDIVDNYKVDKDNILRWALRPKDFSVRLCRELVKRGAKVIQAWVSSLDAYYFCLEELGLDKIQVRLVDRTPEVDSEAIRMGLDSWSLKPSKIKV